MKAVLTSDDRRSDPGLGERPLTEHKRTVEKYMAGFRTTDHAAILPCLTDDVECVMPGMFHSRGKPAFDRAIEHEAFMGKPEITVPRLAEEADVVVPEGSVRTQRREGDKLNLRFCDVFAMIFTVLMVGCSGQRAVPTTGDHAIRSTVDSAANRLLAALRANASDSLLALMADDVVIMPPNEPVLRGKAAVRAWYDHFLTQMRTSSLTVSDREVLLGEDWATEVAGFEWALVPVAGGSPLIDRGSYIQVWHRGPDGRWLFSREVWNSSTPLPEQGQGR